MVYATIEKYVISKVNELALNSEQKEIISNNYEGYIPSVDH